MANDSDYAALHYDTTQCIAPLLAFTTRFSVTFYGLEAKTEGQKASQS